MTVSAWDSGREITGDTGRLVVFFYSGNQWGLQVLNEENAHRCNCCVHQLYRRCKWFSVFFVAAKVLALAVYILNPGLCEYLGRRFERDGDDYDDDDYDDDTIPLYARVFFWLQLFLVAVVVVAVVVVDDEQLEQLEQLADNWTSPSWP